EAAPQREGESELRDQLLRLECKRAARRRHDVRRARRQVRRLHGERPGAGRPGGAPGRFAERMRRSPVRLPAALAAMMFLGPALAKAGPQDAPPTEWIEPATGHRVVRLSREPGSASLYFHQNAYSADGRKLVVTTPGGLATVDLK